MARQSFDTCLVAQDHPWLNPPGPFQAEVGAPWNPEIIESPLALGLVQSQRRSRLKKIFHPIKALIRIFKYLKIDQCKVIQVYSYLNSSSKLVLDTLAGDLKTREIRGELINWEKISYAPSKKGDFYNKAGLMNLDGLRVHFV